MRVNDAMVNEGALRIQAYHLTAGAVTRIQRQHAFRIQLDPRFQDSSIVVSGPGIRYYAGFPVDAPGGQRIGALCVFDTVPHAADDIDVELLRGLAQLVQDELALPSDPRR